MDAATLTATLKKLTDGGPNDTKEVRCILGQGVVSPREELGTQLSGPC
jgi:hypothetical protein